MQQRDHLRPCLDEQRCWLHQRESDKRTIMTMKQLVVLKEDYEAYMWKEAVDVLKRRNRLIRIFSKDVGLVLEAPFDVGATPWMKVCFKGIVGYVIATKFEEL